MTGKRNAQNSNFEKTTGTLEERLQGALAKLALAARHDYRKKASGAELSAVQAQILSLLSRDGAMEIGDLAKQLALTPATVSDSVAALERRRLVRREPSPEDRRQVRVIPAPAGKRLGRSLASWPEIFQQGLSGLSRSEKEVFFRVLVRMILSLLAEGTIQQAKMCVTCAYFRPDVHKSAEKPHHCALVNVPLGPVALRLDCPDHEEGRTASEALARLDRWIKVAS